MDLATPRSQTEPASRLRLVRPSVSGSAIANRRAPVSTHVCRSDAPTLSPATAINASDQRACSSSEMR